MGKYINIEEVERIIRNDVPLKLLMTNSLNCAVKNGIEIAEIISKKAKPADVAEVKHGFWEQGDYYDMGDVCSECQYDSCQQPCHYRYCPNCGTKMDGERKESND